MVDVLLWGVLVLGKFKLKVNWSMKTPWQKHRAVGRNVSRTIDFIAAIGSHSMEEIYAAR